MNNSTSIYVCPLYSCILIYITLPQDQMKMFSLLVDIDHYFTIFVDFINNVFLKWKPMSLNRQFKFKY